MDRGMIIFMGALLTFASSWLGLVLIPQVELTKENPHVIDEVTSEVYPRPLSALEEQGRKVYMANGCIYCHSQYVRSEKMGNNSDILRNWGGPYNRRTVSLDYIYDQPILLGTMRTGPDLSNVGARWSDDWQYKHLFNPRMMVPESIMPPFRFLFEKRKRLGQGSRDAIVLSGRFALPSDQELTPTEDGKALIAYLHALVKNADLPEAHEP